MKVLRAKTAGFCMGVSLALKKLESALEQKQGRICTLGPIIHNPQALAEFEARGVVCLERPEEAEKGDHVLIRAHGIPREVEEQLRSRVAQVVDATCPKVKKAQLAIARATAKKTPLLLFGESDHPEVAGLVSYACGQAYVFNSERQLEQFDLPESGAIILASQTTQDRDAFARICEVLDQRGGRLKILSTICDATRERQSDALQIARQAKIMVVVGGRSSGNTRRLAAIASGAGIPALHVETAAELHSDDFTGLDVAGLTAGASTPRRLIDEAEAWLVALNS